MLFLWFYHACRRNSPRFLMVSDHINYLTFEDPGAVHTVRRALKLAHAGDLYGAAETAGVDVTHAAVVGESLRRGMRFSIGAEVDNDPRARPDAQNIVDAMRPDGIIRSVHFLPIDHPEKGADYMWPYDNPEFAHLFDHVGVERTWELYTARLFEDIEKLPGHVVGHFYRPTIFGHWPDEKQLEKYEDQLLDLAHARGMAIEINTRQLYRSENEEQRAKYVAANKRLMRKAAARGVGIAIGSDAHSPKDQGGGFDAVLAMLDECGINEIVFPVAGRLARVVLRATREHLEAHAQRSPEPVQPGSSISGFSRAELGLPDQPELQPRTSRESAKALRDAGPKKRASSPERTTKKPAAEASPKSSSKRSAESSASSAKSKETKSVAKAPAKKLAPAKKTPAIKKSPPIKKAAPVKKTAAVKKVAPLKKAAAKKAVPAKKAAPLKKAAAKKIAPAKKAAPAAKKSVAKKSAPAKKLAPVKKVAPAKKPAAKRTAKKAAKPASKPSKGTTKKKTVKRR
ncbi:MAG TPA: PHP domain-containing protein [Alphaproteobacteria bacterium]|nr:PHP domain-containing protein [Alphaproteobacteria bacterium]